MRVFHQDHVQSILLPDTTVRYHFQDEQWLPFSVEIAFAFFADPANLPPLMPAWQQARIETAQLVQPAALSDPGHRTDTPFAGEGSRITLSFFPFPLSPVRLRWDAEIQDFEWNRSFTDMQLRGPFAYWRHRHSVIPEIRDGRRGTRLLDEVSYEPPLGKLGEIANSWFIAKQLRQTFAYRHALTLELLSAADL